MLVYQKKLYKFVWPFCLCPLCAQLGGLFALNCNLSIELKSPLEKKNIEKIVQFSNKYVLIPKCPKSSPKLTIWEKSSWSIVCKNILELIYK